MLGQISVSQKQGKRLGLAAKCRLSPVLQKCGLRLCAQSSYEQAAENSQVILGLPVGSSVLHRLVQGAELPEAASEEPAVAASIDGGKIRIRSEAGSGE